MLLTAGYVLWPVARVCLLVVEQPPDAELLRGRPVPACPVASTGGLVAEYSVQPVTVLRTLGRVCQILIFADVRMSPWVITPVCYALVFSNPNQTIRAVVELGFPKLAFPIPITVLNVTHDLGLC